MSSSVLGCYLAGLQCEWSSETVVVRTGFTFTTQFTLISERTKDSSLGSHYYPHHYSQTVGKLLKGLFIPFFSSTAKQCGIKIVRSIPRMPHITIEDILSIFAYLSLFCLCLFITELLPKQLERYLTKLANFLLSLYECHAIMDS